MPIRAGSTPVVLKSGRRSGMKVGGQGLTVAAAPFDPTTISGLVAWYDFSDIASLWKDTARTSAVTADADSIAGVTDKSGTTNHLSQATAGFRPLYKTGILNSKSACLFQGTDDVLIASASVNYAQPNTVFIVGKHGDGAAAQHFFDGNNTSGRQVIGTNTGPVWLMYAGTILNGGATNTNSNIFAAQFNGGSSKLYVNGGSTNAAGAAGAQPIGAGSGGLVVGAGFGGVVAANYLPNSSYIYEILIYNAGLNLSNINTVGSGLGTKWGLTWTTAT